MNKKQVNFKILGAMALAAMVIMNGCAPEKKAYTLADVQVLIPSLFEGKDAKKALLNERAKMAYVKTEEGKIFSSSLKDGLAPLNDRKNWKKLTLKNDQADDKKGSAKLDQYEPDPKKRSIFATEKGIALTAVLNTGRAGALGTNIAALAYFEGDALTPTNAWTNTNTHKEAGSFTDDLVLFSQVLPVKMTDGTERLVVMAGDRKASSVAIGANKFKGMHQADGGTVFKADVQMAAGASSLYFVDSSGINILELSKLNDDNDTEAIVAETNSDKWKMDSAVDNNSVQEAVLHTNKLYIALGSGIDTGGIAIYDIEAKKASAPVAANWADTNVSSLRVVNDKLTAVVNHTDYVNIKDDGSVGDEIFSLAKVKKQEFISSEHSLAKDLEGKTFYTGDVFFLTAMPMSACIPFGDELLVENQKTFFTITQKTIKAEVKEEESDQE